MLARQGTCEWHAFTKRERLFLLVSDELHLEFGGVALTQDRWISQGHEPSLVECIRT